MTLLFKIIYAAHANGTHHKLALDALRELQVDAAEDWRRMFLKHAELFLEGSKAPDKEFKDFKNHVLHPGDAYWGGAPEKVRNWYNHTVQALGSYNWSEAAYCAGVMSHYYTDPVHPFHTAQSKAENAIHRAVEWSINKSYNAIRREALARGNTEYPKMTDGPNWVETFVCESADRAHQDYERLIAHYDFSRGSVIPETGLDDVGRETVGTLLLYAASGFAQLLDRAIIDARVVPPTVSLTADTAIASLKIPAKWVLRKIEDSEDRRVVQAMFDELQKTGDVAKTLPEDDRVILDLHEREVAASRRKERSAAREQRCSLPRKASLGHVAKPDANQPPNLASGSNRPIRTDRPTIPSAQRDLASLDLTSRGQTAKPASTQPSVDQHAIPPMPVAATPEPVQEQTSTRAISVPSVTSASGVTASPSLRPNQGPQAMAIAADAAVAENIAPLNLRTQNRTGAGRPLRFFIEKDSPVVDAPSIGNKTAERLAPAGIKTINDLLTCDPKAVAAQVAMRHITPAAIRDWQDQTRLVLTIPELRGTHAQLLVGAGFRTTEAVANASVEDVCAGVLDFAQSSEGQRLLRDGAAPDIEKIKTWSENAQYARAA
ncbi:MAG: DUF4332 domain-containing protein [Pseudomonadota bacterium]